MKMNFGTVNCGVFIFALMCVYLVFKIFLSLVHPLQYFASSVIFFCHLAPIKRENKCACLSKF
jgi:hypothetical protein